MRYQFLNLGHSTIVGRLRTTVTLLVFSLTKLERESFLQSCLPKAFMEFSLEAHHDDIICDWFLIVNGQIRYYLGLLLCLTTRIWYLHTCLRIERCVLKKKEKVISILTKYSAFLPGKQHLYHFYALEYPTKIHFSALASNLSLCCSGIWPKQMHPKMSTWFSS